MKRPWKMSRWKSTQRPARSEGGGPDGQGEDGSGRGARHHGKKDRGAPGPEGARDQGAESEEGGVSQVHLPNVAGEDIPALRQRDREQDKKDEVEDVVASDGQRQERQRGEGEENAGAPGELASIRERGHRPKSPRGRTQSTTTKMTRPTTSR